jgi:hypothetical protein
MAQLIPPEKFRVLVDQAVAAGQIDPAQAAMLIDEFNRLKGGGRPRPRRRGTPQRGRRRSNQGGPEPTPAGVTGQARDAWQSIRTAQKRNPTQKEMEAALDRKLSKAEWRTLQRALR